MKGVTLHTYNKLEVAVVQQSEYCTHGGVLPEQTLPHPPLQPLTMLPSGIGSASFPKLQPNPVKPICSAPSLARPTYTKTAGAVVTFAKNGDAEPDGGKQGFVASKVKHFDDILDKTEKVLEQHDDRAAENLKQLVTHRKKMSEDIKVLQHHRSVTACVHCAKQSSSLVCTITSPTAAKQQPTCPSFCVAQEAAG
jgi:hypothetical protein